MAIFDDLGQSASDLATGVSGLPSTGGKIWIGAGTEEIATAVDLVDNLYIKGAGMGLTTLKATAAMTAILQSNGGVSNVIIEDLTFDVDSQASTSCIQLYNGGSTNITFRRCEFKNTVGAWQVRIGYAAGSVGSPGTKASNTGNVSSNIRVEDCRFDTHTTTTLEQLILVNSKDCEVVGCLFDNNSTTAASISAYAFSDNIRIANSSFRDVVSLGVIVQFSDGFSVDNCDFTSLTPNLPRFIDVVNTVTATINNCRVNAYGTGGTGATFIAIYDYSGATFESGVYTINNANSSNITVDGNAIDGVYSAVSVPQQTDAGKAFAQTDIVITDNVVTNSEGIPFVIGNNKGTGIARVNVSNNVIGSFKGDDLGAIWISADTTDTKQVIVKGNIIPVSGQGGSNAYAIFMNKVEDVIIEGNDVTGKGTRNAITLTNDDLIIMRNNNTNETGVSFATSRGIIKDNLGADGAMELVTIYAKNTDGDAMVAGDIVILKAVAAGNEVTHTTTGADNKVYGMATEAIANNASGHIQILGKTTALKVDGTTDIAIGDFIATFTTEGIGQKASAGDVAIAKALEAYTTNDSSGVIDALIISPVQIK